MVKANLHVRCTCAQVVLQLPGLFYLVKLALVGWWPNHVSNAAQLHYILTALCTWLQFMQRSQLLPCSDWSALQINVCVRACACPVTQTSRVSKRPCAASHHQGNKHQTSCIPPLQEPAVATVACNTSCKAIQTVKGSLEAYLKVSPLTPFTPPGAPSSKYSHTSSLHPRPHHTHIPALQQASAHTTSSTVQARQHAQRALALYSFPHNVGCLNVSPAEHASPRPHIKREPCEVRKGHWLSKLHFHPPPTPNLIRCTRPELIRHIHFLTTPTSPLLAPR